MRLPVTFKQVDLEDKINNWVHANFGGQTPERMTNALDQENARKFNQPIPANETYYYFYHTTWFGLVIDTIVTVHDCS